MDLLVCGGSAPVAVDSADDAELDEQHWSHMDGFAGGMTPWARRSELIGRHGPAAFTWSIYPTSRPAADHHVFEFDISRSSRRLPR
ncbi:MAG: hypothetical protein LC685_03730 [Actinobacteria bacterium]|nr:hypothetical protein [Actinomycetota bacterium]